MIVGSIVLATNQGLGYLAKAFFDNGIINKVCIKHHTSRKNYYDWYPEEARVNVDQLLECDVLLFFETAFDWQLIKRARAKGIRTVLMPMYECTPHPLPVQPDFIICPSLLDLDYYNGTNSIFLPVPVDVPWKERKQARIFVHNAGNGGIGGRNGTKELIEAMPYVNMSIRLIIRSQVPLERKTLDSRIIYEIGQQDKNLLFEQGDVFIFPEKFNGLSLPLQEAYASGMLVMCGNRFPMTAWLPKEPMIPIKTYTKENLAVNFDCAVYDPKTIAATIEAWYNRDIKNFSVSGREWAKQNSWEKLKPKYLNVLSGKPADNN